MAQILSSTTLFQGSNIRASGAEMRPMSRRIPDVKTEGIIGATGMQIQECTQRTGPEPKETVTERTIQNEDLNHQEQEIGSGVCKVELHGYKFWIKKSYYGTRSRFYKTMKRIRQRLDFEKLIRAGVEQLRNKINNIQPRPVWDSIGTHISHIIADAKHIFTTIAVPIVEIFVPATPDPYVPPAAYGGDDSAPATQTQAPTAAATGHHHGHRRHH